MVQGHGVGEQSPDESGESKAGMAHMKARH